MSYDLMVFKKQAAPTNRADFMSWYYQQIEWSEDHSYDDPSVANIALANWFKEMIITFPCMNGPYAIEVDDDDDTQIDDYITGYSIGEDIIYVDFRWSVAEEAYNKVVELAEKHKVGFFNVSDDEGEILFPENGLMVPIESLGQQLITQSSKPWWKFWSG